ncbi:MAG TPA: CpcT/CpeT family chromophore lyase [Steroidobacteraceae bacterium]|nr:CpcT/CpeT family chromophore lyase [Steroidobacteraceae bacterium]
MLLLAGVAALVAGSALGGSDVDALEHLWPGVRDSSEEVFVGTDASVATWGEGSERRVRTVVAPVSAPWLGAHVLYLEEFLHDDPDTVRRQLLLDLEPGAWPARGVRVRVFSFVEPGHWVHLDRRPRLIAALRSARIAEATGCELLLRREGEQFSGGTVGHHCKDPHSGGSRYVDYQLVIGSELYWYRRRVLLGEDLQEEVIGFNWFELNEARLFTCRVDWSASGRRSDLRPLARLELHDQGGHGRFTTPDGRQFELTLHSQDWPYMADRDALILLVQDPVEGAPLASAWTEIDSDDISVDLGWMQVHCGSLVPDTDELWSDARGASGGPAPPADFQGGTTSAAGSRPARFRG